MSRRLAYTYLRYSGGKGEGGTLRRSWTNRRTKRGVPKYHDNKGDHIAQEHYRVNIGDCAVLGIGHLAVEIFNRFQECDHQSGWNESAVNNNARCCNWRYAGFLNVAICTFRCNKCKFPVNIYNKCIIIRYINKRNIYSLGRRSSVQLISSHIIIKLLFKFLHFFFFFFTFNLKAKIFIRFRT